MSMGQDDPRRAGDAARAAGDAVEKTATEASGGTKTGQVRWMLVIGLLLVVIALGAAWLSFASRPKHETAATATPAASAPAAAPNPSAG